MDIYGRIRARRIALNMSQDELAQKVGYTSRSSINKIEAGLVDISLPKVEAFANALKTTTAYLMGWVAQEQVKEQPYYVDQEAKRLAEEAFHDPDLKLLLSIKRDLSPEAAKAVIDMVKLLKKNETPDPEDFADEIYPDEFNQDNGES